MLYRCSEIVRLVVTTLRFLLTHPLLQRRLDGLPHVKCLVSSMFSLLEQLVFLANSIASFVDFMKHTFILRLTRSLHDGLGYLFRGHPNTNFHQPCAVLLQYTQMSAGLPQLPQFPHMP